MHCVGLLGCWAVGYELMVTCFVSDVIATAVLTLFMIMNSCRKISQSNKATMATEYIYLYIIYGTNHSKYAYVLCRIWRLR